MLIPNCLFRVGGAAIVLSNKPQDARRAKYRLVSRDLRADEREGERKREKNGENGGNGRRERRKKETTKLFLTQI